MAWATTNSRGHDTAFMAGIREPGSFSFTIPVPPTPDNLISQSVLTSSYQNRSLNIPIRTEHENRPATTKFRPHAKSRQELTPPPPLPCSRDHSGSDRSIPPLYSLAPPPRLLLLLLPRQHCCPQEIHRSRTCCPVPVPSPCYRSPSRDPGAPSPYSYYVDGHSRAQAPCRDQGASEDPQTALVADRTSRGDARA